MLYKINEIFYSIQGEGRNVGMPAIFIRFAGCNLDCPVCDTDHFCRLEMSVKDIIEEIQKYKCKNIILTGGEPTIQNIFSLVNALYALDYFLHIETNGTNKIHVSQFHWVTVSPKDWLNQRIGYELKVVYTGQSDKILHNYFNNTDFDYYFLQPEGNRADYIKKAIKFCKENPQWRLSIQMHKLLNIQ